MIGGYISTKVEGPNIVVWDDTGVQPGRIVQIEGVLIDGSSGVQSDGIDIKAPKTIVQIKLTNSVTLSSSCAAPAAGRAAGAVRLPQRQHGGRCQVLHGSRPV